MTCTDSLLHRDFPSIREAKRRWTSPFFAMCPDRLGRDGSVHSQVGWLELVVMSLTLRALKGGSLRQKPALSLPRLTELMATCGFGLHLVCRPVQLEQESKVMREHDNLTIGSLGD